MKRLVLFVVAQILLLGAARAQTGVAVRFVADPCGQFFVDGKLYRQTTTFLWAKSSFHTVVAGASYPISSDIRCEAGGFSAADTAAPPIVNNTVYVVGPATYEMSAAILYRLRLILNNGTRSPSFTCPSSGLFLSGACYDVDQDFWLPTGTVISAAAKPPAGWAFVDWLRPQQFQGSTAGFTLTLAGPLVLQPRWSPAGHFSVNTNPPGLSVLIDRSPVKTPATVEWAPGSTHTLAPLSPQDRSLKGDYWVFSSWSDNGPDIRTITAPAAGRWPDPLTANYVQGAKVSFGTIPAGLGLTIDGRTNWPNYNFVWGIGSKHTIAAPLDQSDGKGKHYVFRKWSIGGAAEQDYTVGSGPQVATNAYFDALGQLLINSSEPNVSVMVDGSPCATPCAVNRSPGTQIKISAPQTIPLGQYARLDFQGWADGGPAERVWTATNDGLVLSANYRISYRIMAVSDPVGGCDFKFDPASPDGFYPVSSKLSITALPKSGYNFRVWDGAVQLSPTLQVEATAPSQYLALLDSYPYLGTGSVQNAAAETPEKTVAPGSIISIVGANLASSSETGPASPLVQTLAGVTVQVNDRYLPLFSVSPSLISAQLSSSFADGEYTLTVHQQGESDVSTKFIVKRDAPGLFTKPAGDKTYALATHEDGSAVTTDSPAVHGETITLLGTGFGPSKPATLDGFAVPLDPKNVQYPLTDSVQIRVGDSVVLQPLSAQVVKGSVGMISLRVKIADTLPAGQTIELRAAVKDPRDASGKTYHESNKVLLPLK